MDEFTFEELFFEGIPDAEYNGFANLCMDIGNNPDFTIDNAGQTEAGKVPQKQAQEMSLLSKDEKELLQSIPGLCKKVEELRVENRDSIAEMNTMRRFLERLEIWVGQIHVLLQSIENRLAQGTGRGEMESREIRSANGEATENT